MRRAGLGVDVWEEDRVLRGFGSCLCCGCCSSKVYIYVYIFFVLVGGGLGDCMGVLCRFVDLRVRSGRAVRIMRRL